MSYGFIMDSVPKTLLNTIVSKCNTAEEAREWVVHEYLSDSTEALLGDCLGSWLFNADGSGVKHVCDLGICLGDIKSEMLEDLCSMGHSIYDYGNDISFEKVIDHPKEAFLRIAKAYADYSVELLGKQRERVVTDENGMEDIMLDLELMVDFCRRRGEIIERKTPHNPNMLNRGTYEDGIFEMLWLAHKFDESENSLVLYFYG